MRIGIFGGTFDPPHASHVMACLWALQSGQIDRVVVVPTFRHAFGKQPEASFEDRLEMCRLAVEPFQAGLVEISGLEGARGGVSYMIDTVRDLKAQLPGEDFRLMAGTDILPDLPRWREGDRLVEEAPVLEIPRIVQQDPHSEAGPRPGALPMLSSTSLREKLSAGEDVEGLLPRKVLDYIRARGLYAKPTAG